MKSSFTKIFAFSAVGVALGLVLIGSHTHELAPIEHARIARSTPSVAEKNQVTSPKKSSATFGEKQAEEILGVQESLLQIQQLSRIVLKNSDQLQVLRNLLSTQQLKKEIRKSLTDESSYEGPKFFAKLRLLDALYEGLKFPDRAISDSYIAMTEEILTEALPPTYPNDAKLRHEFFADRTEIALTLLKVFPERAEDIRNRLSSQSQQAERAFSQAQRLMNTYEVAL